MTKFESVLAEALKLDEDERQLLAIRLGLSVSDDKESGYDDAWAKEIKQRLAEIDRDEAELVEWEEFRKELVADD